MAHISYYPSPVQEILHQLTKKYGEQATALALQALDVFSHTPSSEHTVSEVTFILLGSAYIQCYRQTGDPWVHQAALYNAVRTLDPQFTYKPMYKTWPKFLLAQSALFEHRMLHEQLYVRQRPLHP